MPTEPIREVYPETAGDAKVMKILGRWADGVQECVSFGTHVAKWCMDNPHWKDERSLPILLPFRHALELLDSISVLIRHGLADPCKILLRSLFETWMGIEYIVQMDSGQRAMSFLVWHVKQKKKSYLQLSEGSPENKQFRAVIKKDNLGFLDNIRPVDGISRYIDRLNRLLDKPMYQKVVQEFERVQKAHKRNPNWFSLYGGPCDIKQLAERLGHSGMYEILYRVFSATTHGIDVVDHKISQMDNGLTGIVQIRFALHAQNVTSLAISFALSLFRIMIKFHKPDYKIKLEEWYVREMRDLQMWLISGDIIKET